MVDDLYFTTFRTDQQIKLNGDTPFKDGNNTVVISAEGYEDLTLTVTKDGTLVEDSDDGTIEPEEAQAPTVEAFISRTKYSPIIIG